MDDQARKQLADAMVAMEKVVVRLPYNLKLNRAWKDIKEAVVNIDVSELREQQGQIKGKD